MAAGFVARRFTRPFVEGVIAGMTNGEHKARLAFATAREEQVRKVGFIIIDAGGFGGTYTVASDCTGTISVPDGPSFNMYVGPGAQKFWFTQTAGDPAGLGVGTATRVQ